MRMTIVVLACIELGAVAVARGDPPPTTQNASATAAAQPSPTPGGPATAPQKETVVVQGSEQDLLEKHFIAEGYKEEMHNGEKLFCRREEATGSHLGARKVCGSAQQLQENEQEARAAYARGQMQQSNPSGR